MYNVHTRYIIVSSCTLIDFTEGKLSPGKSTKCEKVDDWNFDFENFIEVLKDMELFMYVCIWKRKTDKTNNNLKIECCKKKNILLKNMYIHICSS